jgi:hypothetical protein
MHTQAGVLFAIACVCFVAGCASSEPDLRDDRTAVVPGRETSDLNQAEARHAVLLEAAHVTIDNGYQYFIVLRRDVWTPSGSQRAGTDSAIRPGDDVTFKVFHAGELSPGTRDVFDAQRLLSAGASQANAPVYIPRSANPSAREPGAPASTAHCTAYGCTW